MKLAATGHRPSSLLTTECAPAYSAIQRRLLYEVAKHELQNTNDIECVIVGGALGWDTTVAQTAYQLGIPYHLYLPYEWYNNTLTGNEFIRHKWVKDHASETTIVCQTSGRETLFKRNHAMVDNADCVFALLNPLLKRGGTFECVNYARKQNKIIYNTWDTYHEMLMNLDAKFDSMEAWIISDFTWFPL